MKTSARLLTTNVCNKNCLGCCNKNWKYYPPTKISGLSILRNYKEILITGGEPMLFPEKVEDLLNGIYHQFPSTRECARTILYTSAPDYEKLGNIVWMLDGLTITIHDDDDVIRFNENWGEGWGSKLYRVNVFHKDITIPVEFYNNVIYKNVEWIKDCPLPPNEDFLRLNTLWR
jgi:MoaA/NifB/PqqE/SkfB family radical SAM enzyme